MILLGLVEHVVVMLPDTATRTIRVANELGQEQFSQISIGRIEAGKWIPESMKWTGFSRLTRIRENEEVDRFMGKNQEADSRLPWPIQGNWTQWAVSHWGQGNWSVFRDAPLGESQKLQPTSPPGIQVTFTKRLDQSSEVVSISGTYKFTTDELTGQMGLRQAETQSGKFDGTLVFEPNRVNPSSWRLVWHCDKFGLMGPMTFTDTLFTRPLVTLNSSR